MRTEDKIQIILGALHASQEVKDAMQEYVYDLVDAAYRDGYNDAKMGFHKRCSK